MSQDTNSGNWVVMTFAFTAPDGTATLTCRGGAGNLNAFALEGTVPARWQWANPKGGSWSDAANWANTETGGDPWLRDLEGADGAVEITYDANPEPERVRCDATATAYVLKAGAFGCAFVDGEVVKDGPGTVALTSGETTADFCVTEGTLQVEGTAGDVTVATGAAIGGAGKVAKIAFQDGAILDAAAGTLTTGALAVDAAALLDKSLPGGVTLSATATVTVRGAKEGEVLRCGAVPEGLTFVLPEGDGGTLTFEDGALRYAPPAADPGYRLRLR